MCLYINRKKGFVLKKDIKCYKVLNKESDDKYTTQCQRWPVTLGTTLVPDESTPNIESLSMPGKYSLDSGSIHAYLRVSNISDGEVIIQAKVPAGTKVWIQDDLSQVAAEKLEMSDVEVTPDQAAPDYSFLEELISIAADVRLKSGKRISANDPSLIKDDVLGIYVGSTDQAVGLEINLGTEFSEKELSEDYPGFIDDWDKAKADKDGEANSTLLEKHCSGSVLKALEWCRKNGGYLPSMNQLKEMSQKLLEINITRALVLGLDPIPLGWFWSSTTRNKCSVWRCYSDGLWHWLGWDYCGYRGGFVCLFLSSHEESGTDDPLSGVATPELYSEEP